MNYGDLFTVHGHSFRFVGNNESGSNDPDILGEACDPEFNHWEEEKRTGNWFWHSHDDYYFFYSGDVKVVSADDPVTFIGAGL